MAKRQVEVFTAACPLCDPAVELVQGLACPDCEVTVYDLREVGVDKARQYGLREKDRALHGRSVASSSRVPTVVLDGTIAACCQGDEVNRKQLQAAGIGERLS